MHTYFKSGNVWKVGFELPAERGYRNFRPMRDCDTEAEAVEVVNFLNGGTLAAVWDGIIGAIRGEEDGPDTE